MVGDEGARVQTNAELMRDVWRLRSDGERREKEKEKKSRGAGHLAGAKQTGGRIIGIVGPGKRATELSSLLPQFGDFQCRRHIKLFEIAM